MSSSTEMSSFTGNFHQDYDVLMPLGEGHFAKVVLAEHVSTRMLVAVKVLQKDKLRPTAVRREVSILKDLQHPNIIQLLEVSENSTTMFLVMEYARGKDLQRHIKRAERQKLQEERARLIFRELLEAVQYCHNRGVIHGDLKPANILMDREGHPKLSDFGVAFRFLPGQEVTTCGGTRQYAAPEIFLQKKYQGPPLDIWSLGILLFEMLAGVRPFSGSQTRLTKDALKGRYQFPQHFSKEVQSLIKGLLNPDPRMRPTLEKVRQHPWLQLESVPCHPPQLLPKATERAILHIMAGKGYNRLKVIDAVKCRKYDPDMAPFLLLQDMALEKLHLRSEVKPTHKREAEDLFEQSTNKDEYTDEYQPSSSSPPVASHKPSRAIATTKACQPSHTTTIKSCHPGPSTPKASRQPSPASPIKSYYTGPATPKASRQPSPASSIKSYHSGPATPKASRQPSPASPIKSYHPGPATPKASGQPSPASSIKSYYTGPATPKASRQPSPASSIKSYYTGPATPKASHQPSPASSIKSYHSGPATPKASRQPSPASPIKSYHPGPATPKASRQPSPASSIKSYYTGPATPKASRQPSPASSIKSYHSGPATPKASRQPSPAVPIKSCKTSRASTESYWQPNPASPGESFQHSPGTPNAAFTAAPAPVSSRRWGWKTVKRTMRDCLQALCCCPLSTCKCHKHKVVAVADP
nr:putative sperm motility kinase W isoform X2 [Cavia porcellus]